MVAAIDFITVFLIRRWVALVVRQLRLASTLSDVQLAGDAM